MCVFLEGEGQLDAFSIDPPVDVLDLTPKRPKP